MTAVDQDGHVPLDEQLVERVHHRVVRMVAVEERMELHAEETRVIEKRCRLLDEPSDARVRPDEPVGAGNGLDDLPHIGVVRMEDQPAVDALRLHEVDQAVPVEPHVEERELSHVHVRVEDAGLLLHGVDTRQDCARYSTPEWSRMQWPWSRRRTDRGPVSRASSRT
jgi:hypothetical protein